MKKDVIEYVKVASVVVIAISLAIIAWNTASQVSILQDIQESLNYIAGRINELKQ